MMDAKSDREAVALGQEMAKRMSFAQNTIAKSPDEIPFLSSAEMPSARNLSDGRLAVFKSPTGPGHEVGFIKKWEVDDLYYNGSFGRISEVRPVFSEDASESAAASDSEGTAPDGDSAAPEPFTHTVPFLAADEAQRIVYGVVLRPDAPDSQGHVVNAAEVEAACHRFNERMQGDLDAHHARLVQSDEARVVESWVQREPAAWQFADEDVTVEVAPGSWCMAVKVYDDGLWSEVVSGEIAGLSPRGRAVARRV
jgi:hypothetical protein